MRGKAREKTLLKCFVRGPFEKVTGEGRLLFTRKWGPLSNIPGHSGIFNTTVGYMFFGLIIPLRGTLSCLLRYSKDFLFTTIKAICFHYR